MIPGTVGSDPSARIPEAGGGLNPAPRRRKMLSYAFGGPFDVIRAKVDELTRLVRRFRDRLVVVRARPDLLELEDRLRRAPAMIGVIQARARVAKLRSENEKLKSGASPIEKAVNVAETAIAKVKTAAGFGIEPVTTIIAGSAIAAALGLIAGWLKHEGNVTKSITLERETLEGVLAGKLDPKLLEKEPKGGFLDDIKGTIGLALLGVLAITFLPTLRRLGSRA